MIQTLEAIGESLGAGDGPARFARAMARADEPYELGAALSLDGAAALIAYNPRVRGGSARARMLGALARLGLDPGPAAAAFALVPERGASTVLGLEWRRGVPAPGATLYLEELTRRSPPGVVAAQARAMARLAGVSIDGEAGRPGPLYILALDLEPGGIRALKIYRRAGAAHAAAVRADLERFIGGRAAAGPLFGGAAASGYIVQRRYAPGRPAAHKVYKCYPYLRDAALGEARAELLGALAEEPPGELAGCLPTSLGLRYEAGGSTPIGGTAYWALSINRP